MDRTTASDCIANTSMSSLGLLRVGTRTACDDVQGGEVGLRARQLTEVSAAAIGLVCDETLAFVGASCNIANRTRLRIRGVQEAKRVLLGRILRVELTPETVDRRVNDAIVSPPQQGLRDACRDPHRPLHHLDGPHRMHASLGVVALEGQLCGALQVAVHDRGKALLGHALIEDDVEPHAIRQRGRDETVQRRTVLQTASLERELP
ncbi:MAG: hypothetical protein QOG65_2005 [Actinomycetota bacterium]|nr:hypothetical protein [Actinomycetota bacterium]